MLKLIGVFVLIGALAACHSGGSRPSHGGVVVGPPPGSSPAHGNVGIMR